ncbi:MAG: hypothetical protein JST63_04235 [Bacteroidetes bacterium]|nr:hypothetical protein [Bacteroidota bacterium]
MEQVEQINDYQIQSFIDTLQQLDTSALTIESYSYGYLKHLLHHKKFYLEIYRTILNYVLKNSTKKKAEMVVIDYGSGNGLLGFFAKHCGFGIVINIDISEEFCMSQLDIFKTNKLEIDEIFCGDIENFGKTSSIVPDALIGTDVIEHIYDLEKFFHVLSSINKNLITVLTTASNEKNWLKKSQLIRIQLKDEWKGNAPSGSNKEEMPFREIRRGIIKDIIGNESIHEIETLVTYTRGLNKYDIEKACKNYLIKKELPPPLQHPTNTCDPITGSWTERLLTYQDYHNLYYKYQFKLSILNGFYNTYQSFPKSLFMQLLNYFIKNFGKFGNFISPFIILVGIRVLQRERNA